MGKLQTAVNLPKRILLQGWANDEGDLNINGEYTYTINFDINTIIGGGPSIFYNGYKHNTLNSFIYFLGGWQFLTTTDPNQWDNPSTNNVLPLTGWIENNAQGPAGTITILEDINTKISIKKQNTGGGKIELYKFLPNLLQGLSLWLKADAGVTLSGSNVIAWADQSGNSRNFTKSIANTGFPTFSNGVLLFTASSTYYDPNASILALPSASLNLTGPYTLIALVRAGANNSAIFNKSNDDNKRRKYQIAINGGSIYALEGTNTEDNYINYDTGTGDDITVKRLIVSKFTSNTSGLIRYNGVEVAVGDGNGPNGEYGYGIDETNSASICIGAAAFQEGTGYNGEASTEMYVYEILFYNRALSTVEIQKIETYLNNKYLIY